MKYEQREELYSLQCIYEDSDQEALQLPRLDDEPGEDGLPIVVNLKVAISAQHKIEMKITLLGCWGHSCRDEGWRMM